MESVDCVVVGAGVIGLAVARRLATSGREVLVLEKEHAIGTETSSRNSEVIHAGIYYPRESNKARCCVAGKEALYRYCAARNISHQRLGKLIVATSSEQIATLRSLLEQGQTNGVLDLELLDASQVRCLEPELRCEAALLSPSTGILDSHAFMLALQADAENAGATFVFGCPVIEGRLAAPGAVLECTEGGAFRLHAGAVVNAAGLHAVTLAGRIAGFPNAHLPTQHLAKGNYYELGGAIPFRHLIYPVPEQGGLGVHLTLDLAGRARFGPDVEWVRTLDYDVDPSRSAAFYGSIRAYWPGLPAGSLCPGYAGIRPKLTPPGGPPTDFVLQGPETHGVPGLVNLFGIESPGLTSALAIADEVERLIV